MLERLGPKLPFASTILNINIHQIYFYFFLSRIHCNKQLIVICVETPSSGGMHHGHNRSKRSFEVEDQFLELSDYNRLLQLIDTEN